MIKTSILTDLTKEQFVAVTTLWGLTGVGNAQRGDSFDAICHTLNHGARIILIYNEEIPVGTVWLTHDFRRLYIHHMAVHPNFQNQGFGKRLMEEALAVAKQLKLQAKLEVHKDNQIAYELYKSFGFQTLDDYHTLIKRDT